MTADHWPTPDDSTLWEAARAGVRTEHPDWPVEDVDAAALDAVAVPAFRAIVAAVWENRLPTPDAYHAACRAVEKHRQRADAAEALLSQTRAASEPAGTDSVSP